MLNNINGKTWDDMRKEFAVQLGCEEPVPSHVLRKAIDDEKYAAYLLAARNHPKYLKILFGAPPGQEISIKKQKLSGRKLITKAASALIRWGKTGFKLADHETFTARFNACKNCSNLQEPPDALLYKIRLGTETDMRVCGACGCVANRKARLLSESCPVEDPGKRGFTFWNEPVI